MIFHDDILIDILSRLPAKSTGRFRCVSKAWRTLLSQPHFIKTHLNRLKRFPSEEQLIILVSVEHRSMRPLFSTLKTAHHMYDGMTAVPSKLSFVGHYIDITASVQNLASCDGLVLVLNKEKRLLLINPTTKENKELPKSPYALDGRSRFIMYGVGYDSVTDDYKVITISYYGRYYGDMRGCIDPFVNVYSVKNGSWKRSVSPPHDHAVAHAAGVFANGHIHWLRRMIAGYCLPVILAFDVGQEQFREMPGPPASWLDDKKHLIDRFSTIGGCLCIFAWSPGGETDVWVMKECGVQDSWTKFTIVHTSISMIRPLCLVGKEHVLLLNEEVFCAELVVYNLKEDRFEDMVHQAIPDEFFIIGACMESLVSPHCIVQGTNE